MIIMACMNKSPLFERAAATLTRTRLLREELHDLRRLRRLRHHLESTTHDLLTLLSEAVPQRRLIDAADELLFVEDEPKSEVVN